MRGGAIGKAGIPGTREKEAAPVGDIGPSGLTAGRDRANVVSLELPQRPIAPPASAPGRLYFSTIERLGLRGA
jgi:hypothetical protein